MTKISCCQSAFQLQLLSSHSIMQSEIFVIENELKSAKLDSPKKPLSKPELLPCYSGTRIDFLDEFYMRNCQHIIDNILSNLSPITVLRASKVCSKWRQMIKESHQFPHQLAQLFEKYLARNPVEENVDIFDAKMLTNYSVRSHKMYPGGDVKIIFVAKNLMYVGLASGITKQWDISSYENLKYHANKMFNPENGKGVTHIDANQEYLATGHGTLVLIWSLETANMLSQAIALDSQLDFIGTLALSRLNKLIMITRFNGYLRVYDDLYDSKFEEYKLEPLQNMRPKCASLSAEAFVYSFQYQDPCPWFWHYRLCVIKVR